MRKKLISPGYRDLNTKLHETSRTFGDAGRRWRDRIVNLLCQVNGQSVLDYGCGKSTLISLFPWFIDARGYDPSVEERKALPRPADVVICTDVLEHVEEEFIQNVLDHLKDLSQKAFFTVIALRKSNKTLADGRNAHILLRNREWWLKELTARFPGGEEVEQANRRKVHFVWAGESNE